MQPISSWVWDHPLKHSQTSKGHITKDDWLTFPIRGHCFTKVIPNHEPQALITFLCSLHNVPWVFRRWFEYGCSLYDWAIHSCSFSQIWTVFSLCINCVLLHEEVSLKRTGSSSNWRDRYLKNNFMNIHFAKILVGSHLQSINSQPWLLAVWQGCVSVCA